MEAKYLWDEVKGKIIDRILFGAPRKEIVETAVESMGLVNNLEKEKEKKNEVR